MIRIIKNGEDSRRVLRFTCESCGCVYEATEDEGDTYYADPDHMLMALKCPMPFCKTVNISSQLFNEGGQS